ncbi:MAG: efflux RND transporter periplasmic adaptor subunit, partial [Desulfotignum sp.]|nr:efflux RND transporter periplasmic adaptor subunit [Desulfotignum sp.]MCF8126448.1 efflux RND transporter periplasmic adaptor subunit [Desulfotignum sp.]
SGQFLLDSESRLKEAIQKMIASKSGTAKEKKEPSQNDGDSFFEEMEDSTESRDDTETRDDFFQDME